MEKLTRAFAALAAATLLLPGGSTSAQAKFHVGIVTATVSQSENDLRGAEQLIKEYGAVKDGGAIQHLTYPDDFLSQQETVISSIVSLASDPLMKAVVVISAIPGTAEAFRRIHEQRPDILLLASDPYEDPQIIETAADLVIDGDYVSRGYTIVWGAKQLGARTFVHISFPRHLASSTVDRRRAVMEAAARDLGLKFADETAADPKAGGGVEGARQSIRQKLPEWIRKYGKKTAFFCTNDIHDEAVRQQLPTTGGIFVEADVPSPLVGYPGALGIDLKTAPGDFASMLKQVEAAVVANAGKGRFGTGANSYGFTVNAGLGTFAIEVTDGKARKNDTRSLLAALGKYTPGARWNAHENVSAETAVPASNHLLISLKTYVLDKNRLPRAPPPVPEKYYAITQRQCSSPPPR